MSYRHGAEVDTLPAGRELDALVAAHIMGLVQGRDFGEVALHDWYNPDDEYNAALCRRCIESMDWTPAERAARERPGPCNVDPRPYSTDIAVAWNVVEQCVAMFPDHERQVGVDAVALHGDRKSVV